jgi:hypothetical protein
MNELAYDQPTGYILIALHKGMNNALTHLETYGLLKTHYVKAQPTLQPTPSSSPKTASQPPTKTPTS